MIFFTQLISKVERRMQIFSIVFFLLLSLVVQGQPQWKNNAGDQTTATGTGVTYTVARPGNVVAGDLIILILTQQRSSTTADAASFTAPGFTPIRTETGNSGLDATISTFYKIATGSEPADYTGAATDHGGATDDPNWRAVVNRVTNYNTTTPIGPVIGNNSGTTGVATLAVSGVTPTNANSLIVAAVSVRTAFTATTTPATMAEQWDINGSGSGNSGTPSTVGATQVIATSGVGTGTRTFSWTGSGAAAGVMFTINPVTTESSVATPTTNLPCWARISQRYWVTARNATGGKIQNGDVVTVAAVINVNNGGAAGTNTWPGSCNTTGTTNVYGFSFQQAIPTNTTYVTGTIKGLTARDIVYTGGSTDNTANMTGNFTDAQDAGDDAYLSGSNVVFNLGTGATNTVGGTLPSTAFPRQASFIYQAVFNVTVNAANGSTINLGGGKIYYRNTAGGTLYEYTLPDMFVEVDNNLPTSVPVDTANLLTAADRGTFGTLKTTKYGDPIGLNVTGFTFLRRTEVNDNEYSIVANTALDTKAEAPADPTLPPNAPNLPTNPTNSATDVVFYQALTTAGAIPGAWDIIADHTRATNPAAGNPLFDAAGLAQGKGYMLLVNGSYAPATVFAAESAGLNLNTYYKVSFWIRNICNNCHGNALATPPAGDENRSNPGVLPNVAFKIDGKIVYTTGQIIYDNPSGAFDAAASRNTWKKREFIYFNQSAGNSIDLELINFAPGGGGNDFVIDDIEIKRVLPEITYTDVCLQAGFSGTLVATVNSAQIPQNFSWYQWQTSDDGGFTWNNETAPVQELTNPQNYTSSFQITIAPLGRKYRIIAGANQADLSNNAFIAGIAVVTVDNCCTTYRIAPEQTGVWSRPENWEFYNPVAANNIWLPAATTPPTGSRVEIRTVFTQDVDFTVQNCPLILNPNGQSKLTINPQITLGFNGGNDGNAYFNSRPVVIKSTAAGTGAIGRMLDNGGTNPGDYSKTFGDDNVTLERFIPGTKRRWNLLTFGVTSSTASIRDAWGGGSRVRVSNSQNANNNLPLGSYDMDGVPGGPYTPKPNNVPFPAPGDYVAGDGTIITGHGHSNVNTANNQGFDWWPELKIPNGATFWQTPTISVIAGRLVTTPSSIRPYRPGQLSNFDTSRGVAWVSQASLNTNYNGLGVSIVNAKLNQVEQGYMLYTRGDRQVLENWFNSTTLRPTGQIKKLNVSVPIVAGPALTPFGNPYPAPIDFEKLLDPLLSTNNNIIESRFYYWDSNIPGTQGNGGWRTVTKISNGNWQAVPYVNVLPSQPPVPPTLTTKVQFISSSQAVLLEGKLLTPASIEVKEDMKVDIKTVNVLPFEVEPSNINTTGILFANYNTRNYANELSLVDGVAVLLDPKFSSETTDESDIKKVYSFTDAGTSMSLTRSGFRLGIEAHPVPEIETIFYLYTTSLEKRNYSLSFHAMDLQRDGREIFLKDNFLGTLSPISATEDSQYDFAGTDDSLSLQPDRFEIVFKQSTILPVTFTSINAVEQQKDIQVTWAVATEENMSHYEVEHSLNGTEFEKAVKVDAKNTSPASYDWLHVRPGAGTHFYRVRAYNKEGRNLTTRIVKVTLGDNTPGFKAFPTVVSATRQVTLQLISLEKGSYSLQVTDMAGRVVSSRTIEHNGGSASMLLQLPPTLSAGKYNVVLNGTSGNFIQPLVKD